MKTSWGWAIAVTLCVLHCSSAPAQNEVPHASSTGYMLPDGSIRVVGALSTQGVIESLDALFTLTHPNFHFRFEKANDAGAIDALIFDATPFAPTGTIYAGGIAYSDIVKAAPFSIRIAHGSPSPKAAVSPLVVIVHPSNPLESVSVAQLASMFSKQQRMRVLTKWSQVGYLSALGSEAIQPAGLPWSDHYASEDRAFADDVFYRRFGGAAPVDTFRMFKTYAEVAAFVAHDNSAIGIVPMNKVPAGVKTVAVVDGAFARAHSPTAEEIRSGRYPLDRYLYLNLRVLNGKPLDAFIVDYVRMALSAEGQAAIAAEGEGYIPLTATEAAEELAKFQ